MLRLSEGTLVVLVGPPGSGKSTWAAEHFDVLIVGAGISGVGSAYHLTKQMPDTSFVILEEQEKGRVSQRDAQALTGDHPPSARQY